MTSLMFVRYGAGPPRMHASLAGHDGGLGANACLVAREGRRVRAWTRPPGQLDPARSRLDHRTHARTHVAHERGRSVSR